MTVPLSEAKSRLDELIAQLQLGEELVLTDAANHPAARLVGEAKAAAANSLREFPKLRHYSAVPVCIAARRPDCLRAGPRAPSLQCRTGVHCCWRPLLGRVRFARVGTAGRVRVRLARVGAVRLRRVRGGIRWG